MEIFDADCGCLGIGKNLKQPVTADDLLRMMDRLQIGRALVRYEPTELSQVFIRRNEALFELASRDSRLCPCPAVAPSAGFDAPAETLLVSDLVRRGARAVTVCPALDHWLVEPFVCDKLFGALQDHRVPVVAPVTALPIEKVAALAGRFPKLPFVATGLVYHGARNVNALLDAFDNTYVSLGDNYTIQGIIEWMVSRYGAERFVLGTGFPESDPACAVTHLAYARITDDAKDSIGQGTLIRLMEEVAQ